MDIIKRKPRIGDRVRVIGFLGEFQITGVQEAGVTVDLKHLGTPGPDYIETEVLVRELIFLDPPRTGSTAKIPTPGSVPATQHSSAQQRPHRTAAQAAGLTRS
jgi:hypothetical protein